MIFYKILYSLCEFIKKRIPIKFKEIFFHIKFSYKNILKYKLLFAGLINGKNIWKNQI